MGPKLFAWFCFVLFYFFFPGGYLPLHFPASLGECIQTFTVAGVEVLVNTDMRKVSWGTSGACGVQRGSQKTCSSFASLSSLQEEAILSCLSTEERVAVGITALLQWDGLARSSSRIDLSQQPPYNLKQVSFSTSKYRFLDISPIFKTGLGFFVSLNGNICSTGVASSLHICCSLNLDVNITPSA